MIVSMLPHAIMRKYTELNERGFMKTTLKRLLPLMILTMSITTATARDTPEMYPLNDVLNSPAAKGKLDPDIKLYFGNQAHSQVTEKIGNWTVSRRTNKIGKSNKEACDWVLIGVLYELQQKARHYGANAVIDIKSELNSKERSSDTEYMCSSGGVASRVTMKGRLVKLIKQSP
ncbi:MAG: excinuclease ABC subunit A [Oxalobacter sp.]|jgi:hypothetical protein|nr:MAG: excinuclease ABC subunit A [Oxalobacter sp.]